MATIPELDLLRPVVSEDLDEWPVFRMQDVNVTFEDGDTQSGRLLGSSWRPRRIIGVLQALEPGQRALLRIKPPRKAPTIQLTGVTTCAYKLDDARELVVRAAGQAGLYVLQPSSSYLAIWKDTTEVIRLFSWLVDIYSGKNRNIVLKQHYWLVDFIVSYYAREVCRPAKKPSQILAQLHDWHDFFLECFLTSSRGVDWLSTDIYIHLAKKFPDTLTKIKAHLELPMKEDSPESQTLPIRTSVGKLTRKRSHAVANSEAEDGKPLTNGYTTATDDSVPSTPKTNGNDRRQYAMKGRSVLRPSAVRLGSRRSSRLNNTTDDDDEEDDTPMQVHKKLDPALDTDQQDAADADGSSSAGEDIEEQRPAKLDSSLVNGHSDRADIVNPEEETAIQVWPCVIPSCSHQIVASSLPDAQLLLDEHMALHAYDGDARVQLVQRLQHASLPVSHLMERVRIHARAEDLNSR